VDDSIETIYLTVKLCLKPAQTRRAIQEIVWDLDYSFTHDKIAGHKIVEILDRPNQTS
jgi:hypothetical protein